jgi:transcriptional regulator with XRE-family HTH domain
MTEHPIKTYCWQHRQTQADIARRLGVTAANLTHWINGRDVPFQQLVAIAQQLPEGIKLAAAITKWQQQRAKERA